MTTITRRDRWSLALCRARIIDRRSILLHFFPHTGSGYQSKMDDGFNINLPDVSLAALTGETLRVITHRIQLDTRRSLQPAVILRRLITRGPAIVGLHTVAIVPSALHRDSRWKWVPLRCTKLGNALFTSN